MKEMKKVKGEIPRIGGGGVHSPPYGNPRNTFEPIPDSDSICPSPSS